MNAFVGAGNQARKVNNIYLGVGGLARKVSKAYVGVGDKARQCWSSAPIINYIKQLPETIHRAVGASTTDHALIASGVTWNGSAHAYVNMVTAYDKLLVQSFPAVMPVAVQMFAGSASKSGFVIFAGGNDSTMTSQTTGSTYSTSLSRSNVSLGQARRSLAAAYVGDYVLFAGGRTATSSGYTAYVDAFNASLTRTTPTALSVARDGLAGACVTGAALFAGGNANGTHSAVVDVYNTSLTRSTASKALAVARQDMAAASFQPYAIFAGGFASTNNLKNTVDLYDTAISWSAGTTLPSSVTSPSGAAIPGKYAVIAGGHTLTTTNTFFETATAYDASLTRSAADSLSAARAYMATTALGDYMLFAGGANKTGNASTLANVDVYDSKLRHISSDLPGLQVIYTVTTNSFSLTPGSYTLYITGKGGAAGATGASAGQYNSKATYAEGTEDWSCYRTYSDCTGGLGGTGGNAQSKLIDITVEKTTTGSFTVASGNASVTILGNTYTVNNGTTGGAGAAGKITKNAYVDVQCYYDSCTSTPGTDAPFVALTPPHSSLAQYGRGAASGKTPGGAVCAIFKN